MPLTLDCVCPDDAALCYLSALNWVVEWEHHGDLVLSGSVDLTWTNHDSSPGSATTAGGTGTSGSTQSLPVDLQWSSLQVKITGGFAGTQSADPSKYGIFSARWHIEQVYTCTDGEGGSFTWSKLAVPTTNDDAQCLNGSGLLEGAVFASGGSGYVVLYFNGPSPTPCSSGSDHVTLDTFWPSPENETINGDTAGICLCPDGGTPPYLFAVTEGKLPGGQKLDPHTGCISGSPDATSPGSSTMIFTVSDSARPPDMASVTCNFLRHCPTPPSVYANVFY